MLAVEHLAAVGLAAVGGHHAAVAESLLTPAQAVQGRAGVAWMRQITWPDRVPGLMTWGGQQMLAGLIRETQRMLREGLRACPQDTPLDLLTLRVARVGTSGLDALSCPDPLDIGFSPAALGMPTQQRPGVELLAIVGLETVPIVSFARRRCGFLHAGRIWQFPVERRGEYGYHRWGSVHEWALGDVPVPVVEYPEDDE